MVKSISDLDEYFASEDHKQFLVKQKERNDLIREQEEKNKVRVSKLEKANALMEILEIPMIPALMGSWREVYAVDLYEIFMDEEKLRVLISKLRNKALW